MPTNFDVSIRLDPAVLQPVLVVNPPGQNVRTGDTVTFHAVNTNVNIDFLTAALFGAPTQRTIQSGGNLGPLTVLATGPAAFSYKVTPSAGGAGAAPSIVVL